MKPAPPFLRSSRSKCYCIPQKGKRAPPNPMPGLEFEEPKGGDYLCLFSSGVHTSSLLQYSYCTLYPPTSNLTARAAGQRRKKERKKDGDPCSFMLCVCGVLKWAGGLKLAENGPGVVQLILPTIDGSHRMTLFLARNVWPFYPLGGRSFEEGMD